MKEKYISQNIAIIKTRITYYALSRMPRIFQSEVRDEYIFLRKLRIFFCNTHLKHPIHKLHNFVSIIAYMPRRAPPVQPRHQRCRTSPHPHAGGPAPHGSDRRLGDPANCAAPGFSIRKRLEVARKTFDCNREI
jgi:hypothetical protein